MKDSPKDQDLDKLLNETLKSLPGKKAPVDFLHQVMLRVEESEVPAIQAVSPVLRWVISSMGLSIVVAMLVFGQDLFWIARNLLGLKEVEQHLGFVGSAFELLSSVGAAILQALSSIPTLYLAGAAVAVVFLLFTSCLSIGTLLFRLSFLPNFRALQS